MDQRQVDALRKEIASSRASREAIKSRVELTSASLRKYQNEAEEFITQLIDRIRELESDRDKPFTNFRGCRNKTGVARFESALGSIECKIRSMRNELFEMSDAFRGEFSRASSSEARRLKAALEASRSKLNGKRCQILDEMCSLLHTATLRYATEGLHGVPLQREQKGEYLGYGFARFLNQLERRHVLRKDQLREWLRDRR